MAGTNPTPGGEQQYFNVGVIYNTSIDHGSSSAYGYVDVDSGSQMTQDEMKVLSGTVVTFTAKPDIASGFKFKGWFDPDTGAQLRYANPCQITVRGDTYLVPAFEPNAPTFKRPIAVTTQGCDGNRLVSSRSMNGYYTYNQAGNSTLVFNGVDRNYLLPDGKPISVYARIVEGYDIEITADGNPQVLIPMVSLTKALVAQEQYDRGGSGDSEDGDSNPRTSYTPDNDYTASGEIQLSTPEYEMATISNPSSTTSELKITVTYIPKTTYKHIEVNNNPRSGGSVMIYYTPSGEERVISGTALDVPEGSTVRLVATPAAGFNFTKWTSSTGATSAAAEFNTVVNEDVKWTAQFNQSYNTISVQAQPSAGGTVKIFVENVAQASTTIYSNQVDPSAKITILATPNEDYNFLYWYEVSEGVKYYDSELPVTFGDYNLVYVATFDYVPTGSVLYKAYTTAVYGGQAHIQEGANSVVFKATYERSSGGSTTTTVGAAVKDLDILLQSDSGGWYSLVKLEQTGPYIVTEGSHKYRYTLAGYKHADTFISTNPLPDVWMDCAVDAQGYWKQYYPSQDVKFTTQTLTAFFNKEEIFTVSVSNRTPSKPNGSPDITTSGAGQYLSGDSCTVTTSLATGVNTNRYQFAYWAYSSDLDTPVSTSSTYTFQVNSSVSLVAVYREFCYVEYAANPASLGTVTSSTASGSWVEYNSQVSLTATANSGASLLRWLKNGSQIYGSVSSITLTVTSASLSIVAEFIESSKILTVKTGDGGTTQVELKDPDGYYTYTAPDAGTIDKYTVPSGYGVRVTAQPNPRYTFAGFTLLNSAGEIIQTSQSLVFELSELTENRTLVAEFNHIQWISTIGTIIKVF